MFYNFVLQSFFAHFAKITDLGGKFNDLFSIQRAFSLSPIRAGEVYGENEWPV